jgi:hypothetical protein
MQTCVAVCIQQTQTAHLHQPPRAFCSKGIIFYARRRRDASVCLLGLMNATAGGYIYMHTREKHLIRGLRIYAPTFGIMNADATALHA